MLTHHSIQLLLKPQFVRAILKHTHFNVAAPVGTVTDLIHFNMAVTYPPENLIHTQQSHTIL